MAFLKNDKRIFFSILLVATLLFVRGEKQGFDKFSGDISAFPLELVTYFGKDIPKEVQLHLDEFIVFDIPFQEFFQPRNRDGRETFLNVTFHKIANIISPTLDVFLPVRLTSTR